MRGCLLQLITIAVLCINFASATWCACVDKTDSYQSNDYSRSACQGAGLNFLSNNWCDVGDTAQETGCDNLKKLASECGAVYCKGCCTGNRIVDSGQNGQCIMLIGELPRCSCT